MNPKIDQAKEDIDTIIHKIIQLEDEYVLDEKYVRWGKVQRDIHAIIEKLDGNADRTEHGILRIVAE